MRRQGQKEARAARPAPFLPISMKKTEMGRFNISPDEDSSSYSSNSDFNYSYPTKQAALKRWGESALQKQTKTKKTQFAHRVALGLEGFARRLQANAHTQEPEGSPEAPVSPCSHSPGQ